MINNRSNTWNNPYRIAKKLQPYYHEQNRRFERSQPTDSEKEHVAFVEAETRQIAFHRVGRDLQREQLRTRKAAREALQYTSSQQLTKGADKDLAQELAQSEHNIASEFTMQKTYKDPSKHEQLCPVTPDCMVSFW